MTVTRARVSCASEQHIFLCSTAGTDATAIFFQCISKLCQFLFVVVGSAMIIRTFSVLKMSGQFAAQ